MRLSPFFAAPWRDGMEGMERVLDARGGAGLVAMILAVVASWWLYVPVHEMMHAWGCLLAGGTVNRLEIDEIYGAHWLARLFPYVSPGSAYAGRLSGFDTGGSDAVYLVTVAFPFALTVFPGVAALRAVCRAPRPAAWRYGASLPWAYAPFLAITGDYYEMGSILVSRAFAPWLPDAITRWRSDDLFLLASQLFGGGALRGADLVGVAASFLVGVLLAFATYAAGVRLADGARPRGATAV